MTPAMQREQRTYRSLLARVGLVMAGPEPMLPRLVRGCIAPAFTACVLAVARSHHLADDTVKGGELSYMRPAMQREGIVNSSLLQLTGAVLAGPEPILSRLVHGCIALAFTACVLAVACSHCLADTVKGGELSYTTPAMKREATAYRSLLTRITAVPADPEPILSRVQHEGANSDCLALGLREVFYVT